MSGGSSSGLFSKTLPTNSRPRAVARPPMPCLLRWKELWEIQAAAGPVMRRLGDAIVDGVGRAAWRARGRGFRFRSARHRFRYRRSPRPSSGNADATAALSARCECRSGARRERPSATTAGLPPTAGPRSTASRGTRLRRVTPALSATCSRYSPADVHRIAGAGRGQGGGDGGVSARGRSAHHEHARLPARAAAARARAATRTPSGSAVAAPRRRRAAAATKRQRRARRRTVRDRRRGEPLAFHHDHRDVVLAAGAVGGVDQLPHGGFRDRPRGAPPPRGFWRKAPGR